jgi:acyl-coenzyme A synthetase/AMP-(fatty) acid ligase
MQHGEAPVKKRSRRSLRLLGTVGEPINPEVWRWYHRVVGDGRCPVVDTWWQTETGGILISPLPGAIAQKPGSATLPFFGVRPVVVDDEGREAKPDAKDGDATGNLCIAFPWPGMMRTVYGDHERFVETYFTRFPGKYFTGDGCRRDADGYWWITGRVDDVLNVSAHRIGTAELESAIVTHASVAESAVVGPTRSRAGDLRLRDPEDRGGGGDRGDAQADHGRRARRDRRDRDARQGPLRAGARDPQRKIMRRILRARSRAARSGPRRHLDARRPQRREADRRFDPK